LAFNASNAIAQAIGKTGEGIMETAAQASSVSKATLWTGRIISTLIVLFLLMDCMIKFLRPAPVLQTFEKLGLPVALSVPLGIILLACTLLYAVPRTSILGAILLTGYLGGAVLTHVRVGDPLFSHALFPVYLGILAWFALYLRDARLRALVPLKN
jgi:hypothetical protein